MCSWKKSSLNNFREDWLVFEQRFIQSEYYPISQGITLQCNSNKAGEKAKHLPCHRDPKDSKEPMEVPFIWRQISAGTGTAVTAQGQGSRAAIQQNMYRWHLGPRNRKFWGVVVSGGHQRMKTQLGQAELRQQGSRLYYYSPEVLGLERSKGHLGNTWDVCANLCNHVVVEELGFWVPRSSISEENWIKEVLSAHSHQSVVRRWKDNPGEAQARINPIYIN